MINIILDLQFGSTGKGLIAGYLAETNNPDTVITAWAANAGHTYINADGRIFKHTMLANGVVSKNLKYILLGPGSLIDPKNLLKEIKSCQDLLGGVTIAVHKNAAVILHDHVVTEQKDMVSIGSTSKGCGAALIQKISRNPEYLNTAGAVLFAECPELMEHVVIVDVNTYNGIIDASQIVQIEGAQGYSLSIHHGFYPYTTSRDVSLFQTLADCGIPRDKTISMNVVGCCRTYPIRVANRYDDQGNMIGWSGPCYPDQEEITFESIGEAQEYTTVTNLPRRIFTFSETQLMEALRINGVDQLFLNFANYLNKSDLNKFITDLKPLCAKFGGRVGYIGNGPSFNDVWEYHE